VSGTDHEARVGSMARLARGSCEDTRGLEGGRWPRSGTWGRGRLAAFGYLGVVPFGRVRELGGGAVNLAAFGDLDEEPFGRPRGLGRGAIWPPPGTWTWPVAAFGNPS
jgi:hypothetical protein